MSGPLASEVGMDFSPIGIPTSHPRSKFSIPEIKNETVNE